MRPIAHVATGLLAATLATTLATTLVAASPAVSATGEVSLAPGPGDVVIDANTGTMTEDGVVVRTWPASDTTRFVVSSATAPRSLTFSGSDRDEYVYSFVSDGTTGLQQIDLGGGDDTLFVAAGPRLAPSVGTKGSTYVGGDGDDAIDLWGGKRLDVDLAADRLSTKQAGRLVDATLAGFEETRFGARKLEVYGTQGKDDIRFYACTAKVRGRGGNDVLESNRTGEDYDLLDCDARTSEIRIYGDAGKDTLRGSRGKDLLVGGPGRDTIDGNANRDRCSGEKLRNCEVRLR